MVELVLSCEGRYDTSTIVQVVETPRTFKGAAQPGDRLIYIDARRNDNHGVVRWFRGVRGEVSMTHAEVQRTLAEVQGPRRWSK
jgi:hypothetical protein